MVMALAKSVGLLGEPPPQKLTRRLLGVFGINRRRPVKLALATTAVHLGYGVALGMAYSLLPRRMKSERTGAMFGFAVWAVNYCGWIPKVMLMPPPHRDRPGRPTAMVAAHLAYGVTLARVDHDLNLNRLGAEASDGRTVYDCAVDRKA